MGDKNIGTVVEGSFKVTAAITLLVGAIHIGHKAYEQVKDLKTLNDDITPKLDGGSSLDYKSLYRYDHS